MFVIGGCLVAMLAMIAVVAATNGSRVVAALPIVNPPDAHPARTSPLPLLYRVDTDDPVIFVTIDDGTSPSEEALRYVTERDMPVSLFLNESPLRAHADHFRRYLTLGNHVHSHTLTHPELPSLGRASQQHEICGMLEVLRDEYGDTGQVGTLVRPPYGAFDRRTGPAAASCGATAIVAWSGTIEDGDISLVATALQPGDILLTHFTDDLPTNLRAIQQLADESGLQIARLEDYVD